jgi:hypothetical protein
VDVLLLRIFQRQVAFQCRAVSLAAADIDAALTRLNNGDMDGMPRLWFAVQNLLNASANVSKACWGQSGKFKVERKPLRKSLGIKETSPLRATGMRNNFDHYDERLDDWWQRSKSRNHADMNVGTIEGLDPLDSFRVLDPQTLEVIFWGKRYALRTIVTEAERILPVAENEAAKPHWVT